MAITADFNSYEFNVSKFNSDLLSILLSEGMTMADAREMVISMNLTESQFLQDNNTGRQISKGFTEEMRLAAWLTIKRKNSAQWSDQ